MHTHTVHKGRSDVFASTSIHYLFYLLKYHFCLEKTLGTVGFYALGTFPPNKTLPYKSASRGLTSENTLIVPHSNIFHSNRSSCQEYRSAEAWIHPAELINTLPMGLGTYFPPIPLGGLRR